MSLVTPQIGESVLWRREDPSTGETTRVPAVVTAYAGGDVVEILAETVDGPYLTLEVGSDVLERPHSV